MSNLLFTDVRSINAKRISAGDLLVREGRIEAVDSELAGCSAQRVIEARGRSPLPGWGDDHLHSRERGLEDNADIATESAAGRPLMQALLSALIEPVHLGEPSIAQVVREAGHNVAERFDAAEQGCAREGDHADRVPADPETMTRVGAGRVRSQCGRAPFAGSTSRGRVDATAACGEPACCDAALTGAIPGARRAFAR